MDCPCNPFQIANDKVVERIASVEKDLVDCARRMLRSASDPVSAVIKFLHERPEGAALRGEIVKQVLLQTFESSERIPGLVRLLSGHVKEIARQSNVIRIVNEHASVERWGSYLIKQKERIKFEVGYEKGKLALKNIAGLVAVEHGIELALDKILVIPPKLEVTVQMGPLRPSRLVDIV